MANFKEYLDKRRQLIDKALDSFLPGGNERPKTIHKAMRYGVFSGGKRIRPIVAAEACKVCGGLLKDALAIGCAIELVHAHSLIHDDLPSMDDDDYRRGKPACHKVFGEANAILAGDALLALAFNALARGLPPKVGIGIIRELSEAIGTRGMIGGQAVDLEFKNRKKDRKLLDYINRLKTSMLFEISAKHGAIAACAGKQKVNRMADYGKNLGILFQITDDILDGEYKAEKRAATKAVRQARLSAGIAKRALKIFGSSAKRLAEIVDYVLERAV